MALAFTVDVPRSFEANPGIVAFRSSAPVDALAITVNGRRYRLIRLAKPTRRAVVGPFGLPSRDLTIRIAGLRDGKVVGRATATDVLGLPRAAGTVVLPRETVRQAQVRLRRLPRPVDWAAAWAVDLASGRGASWNAGARFTAASTAKLPILMKYLIDLRRDAVGDRHWGDLRAMILESSNIAANTMLTAIGGDTTTGAARVTAMMRRLGATRSDEAGGYIADDRRAPTPPNRVDSEPESQCCKLVTAHDLGVLLVELVRAANGTGRARALGLTGRDARVALWLLAHASHPGLFRPWTRWTVAHKVGYIDAAWHDAAIVFSPQGTQVVVALTEARGFASEYGAREYARGVLRIANAWLRRPPPAEPRPAAVQHRGAPVPFGS